MVLDEQQLVARNLDPIAVEQRRGLNPERDAIHTDDRRRRGPPNGGAPIRADLDDRLDAECLVRRNGHVGIVASTDERRADLQRILLIVDLNDWHGSAWRDGHRASRVSGTTRRRGTPAVARGGATPGSSYARP